LNGLDEKREFPTRMTTLCMRSMHDPPFVFRTRTIKSAPLGFMRNSPEPRFRVQSRPSAFHA
jgi:hypothetical protein